MKKTYPVYSPFFWMAYFVQMRPYLLFVSGIAGVSGMAMGNMMIKDKWQHILAFLLFFLGYGFGQALTDCFQTDTDKISAPYRPLSKGIISTKDVLIVSSAGLLASGILFYWLHPNSFFISLAAVFGLATYSIIKKRFWGGGPFYNAAIVALLPIMGFFAVSPSTVNNFPGQYIPFIVITFFSYANFVLIGYLKDIDADRATSYRTFPVVFGWKKTILGGDLFALVAVIVFWLYAGNHFAELIAGIAATLIALWGQFAGHFAKDHTEKSALIPIVNTVRSFILFHLAIVLHFQPGWWIACLVYYLLFEWALSKRPSKYQV